MEKQFDFTSKHIHTDYVLKNNECEQYHDFNFSYEKANKPTRLQMWYKKQSFAMKALTHISAMLFSITLTCGCAKAGIEVANYCIDKGDTIDSSYDHYKYFGRFHPMNVEINRGR